jgi:hypothetical protein
MALENRVLRDQIGEGWSGLFFIAAAVFLYVWASQHSPHVSMIELLSAADVASHAYYIGEPLYSLIIILASALGLHGFALTMRGANSAVER